MERENGQCQCDIKTFSLYSSLLYQCMNYTADSVNSDTPRYNARFLYETSSSSLRCISRNYDDLVLGHFSLSPPGDVSPSSSSSVYML